MKPVIAVVGAAILFSAGILLAQGAPEKAPDIVYTVGNGVTAPKPVYSPEPQYTEKARKERIRGYVVLSMVVATDGTVRDPRVTASLTRDLDQQALAAVSTWKFKPATKDGKPVAVRIKTSVTFNVY